MEEKIIGVVGGVGPYAGLDLIKKIYDFTKAAADQDHISIAHLALPRLIEDRTKFLLGKSDVNPAIVIFETVRKLEALGAGIIGIPCNTTHAPPIYDVLVEKISKSKSKVKLVNMILEVACSIKTNYPNIKSIGVISTTGTYQSMTYKNVLEPMGFNVILPSIIMQNTIVQEAIYNPVYGIKVQANPVTEKAREELLKVILNLKRRGADAVVLGCTELPLAIPEKIMEGTVIIDSNEVLAKALIREAAPHKLRL